MRFKIACMKAKIVAKNGEDLAERYFKGKNYLILKRNFRCRFGEIDLIAIDCEAKEKEIVFIEVKTRISTYFGEIQESITQSKIRKIIKTALYFLNLATRLNIKNWRIDFLGIKLNKSGKPIEIIHIKNITND